MAPIKCCVGGCDSTSNTCRLFCMPMNDNLRKLWLSFLVPTNPNLLGLTKNLLITKRVCEKHFDETQFDQAGVRIRYSYPCLFTEQEIAHGVPLAKGCHFLDYHNYCQSQEQNDNNSIAEPITITDDMSREHVYSLPSTSQSDGSRHLRNAGSEKGILHKFPNPNKEPERFRTWIYNIGGSVLALDNDMIFKRRRVCHLHFEARYHTRSKFLSADAIPRLCSPGIPLHRFPDPKTNPERYMTWVSSIGSLHLQDKKYVYNNLRVCRKHFKAVYLYPNHQLCKLAIPELQLSETTMKENEKKCCKCGSSPAQDPSVILHRFPKPEITNSLRCELWAKYCFPKESWSSPEFQNKLHTRHLMLCTKHFKRSMFIDDSGKRLVESAAPDEECDKTSQEEEQFEMADFLTFEKIPSSRPEVPSLPPEKVPSPLLEEVPSPLLEEVPSPLPEEVPSPLPEEVPSAPPVEVQFCICCLQQDVQLINLLTCSHAEFLNSLMLPEIKPSDQVVCYYCHDMLKKIKLFELQVQESFRLLSDSSIQNSLNENIRKQHLTIHETLNMEIPETTNIDNLKTIDNAEKSVRKKKVDGKKKVDRKKKNMADALKIPETTNIDNLKTIDNAEKSLQKKKVNRKKKNMADALKIPETTNIDNLKTIDNTEESLRKKKVYRKKKNMADALKVPETTNIDNLKTIDNAENSLRKKKNMADALKIINGNQNNDYLGVLTTSLQSLSHTLISTVNNEFQINKTYSYRKKTDIKTAVDPEDIIIDENIDNYFVIDDKQENCGLEIGIPEMYQPAIGNEVSIDMSESNIQLEATDAPHGKKPSFRSNIKQLKLTKQELLREREKRASSPTYLRTRHRCKSCLIGFQYRDNLYDHIKRKHTPGSKQSVLKCKVCRQFVRRDLYDVHTNWHYNRYECIICGQKFSSYDRAVIHQTKNHTPGVTEWKCSRCTYKTFRRRMYKNHLLVCNTRTSSGYS